MPDPAHSVQLIDKSSGAAAQILVGLGLNCYSFRPMLDGQQVEVLWSEPDFATGTQRPSGSGIPLMFPFPGRLRGKSLDYEEKTYGLNSGDVAGNAIHGYVLDRPWRIIEQAPNQLTAQFQASIDDAERLACWPADYIVTATYAIHDNTLTLDVLIENPTSSCALPFGFGTHPYFRIPLDGRTTQSSEQSEQCTVRVPAASYWELVDMLPNGEKLRCDPAHDLSSGKLFVETQLDDVLTDLTSKDGRISTEIKDASSGRSITMTFDDTFEQCVVYNPPHREAFCIEPITSVPNAYELEKSGVATGLRVLQAGESFSANIDICVS
jgi:aldose 1-epimerase